MLAGWCSFSRSSNEQLPWVTAEKAESRPDVLTSIARAFVVQLAGLTGDLLLRLSVQVAEHEDLTLFRGQARQFLVEHIGRDPSLPQCVGSAFSDSSRVLARITQ